MGCFFLPVVAEDSDLYQINTVFILLASKDPQVSVRALSKLKEVAAVHFSF
ncbi:unnamed protein product [Larinioides sclopetarius]|uniref:Uncharacterized protein n=1 Tax=Larinioides sclopetarius TaxID=280406 RepID=A0AAV1Z4H1_9ARAC